MIRGLGGRGGGLPALARAGSGQPARAAVPRAGGGGRAQGGEEPPWRQAQRQALEIVVVVVVEEVEVVVEGWQRARQVQVQVEEAQEVRERGHRSRCDYTHKR